MRTCQEHAIAWAMLRVALRLDAAQVDQILGVPGGYCLAIESGERTETLRQWQEHIRALARHYAGSVRSTIAEA